MEDFDQSYMTTFLKDRGYTDAQIDFVIGKINGRNLEVSNVIIKTLAGSRIEVSEFEFNYEPANRHERRKRIAVRRKK